MPNPGLAKDLSTEATDELIPTILIIEAGKSLAGRNLKTMRGCTQSDHWPAAREIVDDGLHLLDRQVLKTGEDHHQIRGPQGLSPGNIGMPRLDFPALLIHPEQYGTPQAMMLGQDPPQHRQCFLGFVLVVAGDQHHLLAFTQAVGPLVNQQIVLTESPWGREKDNEQSDS
jgi:hypothetical protein